MKASVINEHTSLHEDTKTFEIQLNKSVEMFESQDSQASHAFIDAHPNHTLVIFGFNNSSKHSRGRTAPGTAPAAEPKVIALHRADDSQSRDAALTPRQEEVLSLLRQGLSNKAIARMLGVAESTVKFHCIAIFRHLGVANRTQAAVRAEELSLP